MASTGLRTFAEARKDLRQRRISIVKWAKDHGFERELVYVVLRGRRKCLRGESRAIGVALGVVPPRSTTDGADEEFD